MVAISLLQAKGAMQLDGPALAALASDHRMVWIDLALPLRRR